MEADLKDVELIFSADCPNTHRARQVIIEALTTLRLPSRWVEWDSAAQDAPAYAKAYGSPTILVDGVDVGGAPPGDTANACRLYGSNEKTGAPPVDRVLAALSAGPDHAIDAGPSRGLRGILGSIVAIVPALLPKLTCAACLPAYAAILGSLGIGFWNYTPYLLPITAVSLGVVLFLLAFRAKQRRGYLPFAAGLVASAVILLGKFYWNSDPLLYAGTAGLLCVSLWNAWPQPAQIQDCTQCEFKQVR